MFGFGSSIGIDLGTANTLVCVKGKGIVLREPSVVALRTSDNKVLAVGEEAKEMIGRVPDSIAAMRPLKDGVIADFYVTSVMLKEFIKRVSKTGFGGKPEVIVCIPSGVTEVERRAVEEVVMQAGARSAYLIEEPMAAAIGADLPVWEPTGNMVVDIGGGTSEIAIISFEGIVVANSLRIAGDEFDQSIINYIRRKKNLMIGECSAEELKINIGNAFPDPEWDKYKMHVMGRDIITGLPKDVSVTADEIRAALSEPLSQIIESIKTTLENCPSELSADIIERGIVLTGGGSLIRGLDKRIQNETKIPTYVAQRPLDCVVEGTFKALENMPLMKSILMNSFK